jgi:hypothetical protein
LRKEKNHIRAGYRAGVVEGGRLQKSLNTRRTTKISIGDVIGAGLFIGGCQFRSRWRRVIGNFVPATKIIRSSPVPVLIIPRSADVRLEDSAHAARGFEREQ